MYVSNSTTRLPLEPELGSVEPKPAQLIITGNNVSGFYPDGMVGVLHVLPPRNYGEQTACTAAARFFGRTKLRWSPRHVPPFQDKGKGDFALMIPMYLLSIKGTAGVEGGGGS